MSPIAVEAPLAEPFWRKAANVVVILFGGATSGLCFAVIGPVLKPMAAALKDEHIAQTVVVMPLLGLGVGGLTGGWIAERLGVKPTIWISALVFALAGLGPSFHLPIPALLADGFVIGFSSATMRIGTGLLLGERYEGHPRARMIGFTTAFGSVSAFLAVWVSAQLGHAVGWPAAFLQFSVAGLIAMACALAGVGKIVIARHESAPPPSFAMVAHLTPVFIACFLMTMAVTSSQTFLPLLLPIEHIPNVASVMSWQPLFCMVMALAYGVTQARIGKLATATLGVIFLIAGAAATYVAHSAWLFALGCALSGATVGYLQPFYGDAVFNRVPVVARGRALGLLSTAGFVGGFVNPFVMRPIREATGLHGLYGVTALGSLIIGVLAIAWGARGAGRAKVVAATIH